MVRLIDAKLAQPPPRHYNPLKRCARDGAGVVDLVFNVAMRRQHGGILYSGAPARKERFDDEQQ